MVSNMNMSSTFIKFYSKFEKQKNKKVTMWLEKIHVTECCKHHKWTTNATVWLTDTDMVTYRFKIGSVYFFLM